MMEEEVKQLSIEEEVKILREEIKRLTTRLNSHEDEIEKIQKDLHIVGENTKVEIPCIETFENSLTKKLIKERNEITNPRETVSS